MNDMPLVSIIMPTYNQTTAFKRAVDSVLKQSYQNIELIIIDDNKDKKLKEQNETFIKSLNINKIIYLQNDSNIGSTASRNRGIFSSNGQYITFLDDDDEYLVDKVKNQVTEMIAKDADFSATNVKIYNELGKLVDSRNRKYLNNKKNESLFIKHLKYHITSTNTLMFKSNYLKRIGGFDSENLGDEFYLMAKAFQNNGKFIHIDTCDVKAYVHSKTGLSSTDNKVIGEEKLFKYKSNYFNEMKKSDIRYIKMRKYAVLAYAYKKSKKYGKCFCNLVKSFFLSPLGVIRLYLGYDK